MYHTRAWYFAEKIYICVKGENRNALFCSTDSCSRIDTVALLWAGPKVLCADFCLVLPPHLSLLIGRNFFHFSTTTFSLLAGEKSQKGKKRPVSFRDFISHRAGKHHPPPPPPPPPFTTLLRDASVSLFLSSVRRSALRARRDAPACLLGPGSFFCAHVFTRSHAVTRFPMSPKID